MFFSPNFCSVALSFLAILPVVRSATFEVEVGGPGGLKYTPESVNAQPGDLVRFIFKQKNHTATQSTLANPCTRSPGGFDSGFIPVADTVTAGFPVAELNITSTDPVWVYCRQGTHCKAGMVFAVNPGSKMDAFKAAATGASPAVTSNVPTSTSTTASSTPSAGTDYKIIVGGTGILAFSPSNITAQVGDTITFEFHQKNHTVTASSFDAPCVPLAAAASGQSVFDSGYRPVADSATVFPSYTIRVNDTKPIWAYCRQGNHCGQGMVFSANAVESGPKNFAAFQSLAKQLNGTAGTGSGYGDSGAASSSFSIAGAAIAALLTSAFLL